MMRWTKNNNICNQNKIGDATKIHLQTITYKNGVKSLEYKLNKNEIRKNGVINEKEKSKNGVKEL